MLSITADLSSRTSLTPDDIISCLQLNSMLSMNEEDGTYHISVLEKALHEHAQKFAQKNYLQIMPEKLTWTPFVLSKERLANLTGEPVDVQAV